MEQPNYFFTDELQCCVFTVSVVSLQHGHQIKQMNSVPETKNKEASSNYLSWSSKSLPIKQTMIIERLVKGSTSEIRGLKPINLLGCTFFVGQANPNAFLLPNHILSIGQEGSILIVPTLLFDLCCGRFSLNDKSENRSPILSPLLKMKGKII